MAQHLTSSFKHKRELGTTVITIQVTDVTENAVDVAAADEPSLRVIRDEVKLHGYQVGEVQAVLDAFRFRATSDDPGKVRKFLMGLADVDVSA